MTKMSKTQRIAILDFHNGVTAKGHTMLADARTIRVLVREGWAALGSNVTPSVARLHKVRVAYVTTPGLVAAGIDMDVIHAQALRMNERLTVARREIAEAADEQATPRYRRFAAATLEGKSYRAALDILHVEALADHALWGTGHAGYQAAINALHTQALVENFLRQPHMVRAMEIGAAERQRAAVDNRAEIGAPRTQRFHALFKITRSWPAALDILHGEALAERH